MHGELFSSEFQRRRLSECVGHLAEQAAGSAGVGELQRLARVGAESRPPLLICERGNLHFCAEDLGGAAAAANCPPPVASRLRLAGVDAMRRSIRRSTTALLSEFGIAQGRAGGCVGAGCVFSVQGFSKGFAEVTPVLHWRFRRQTEKPSACDAFGDLSLRRRTLSSARDSTQGRLCFLPSLSSPPQVGGEGVAGVVAAAEVSRGEDPVLYVEEQCREFDGLIDECTSADSVLRLLVAHRSALFVHNLVSALKKIVDLCNAQAEEAGRSAQRPSATSGAESVSSFSSPSAPPSSSLCEARLPPQVPKTWPRDERSYAEFFSALRTTPVEDLRATEDFDKGGATASRTDPAESVLRDER